MIHDQRGAASLLATACLGVLLLLGAALGVVGALVVDHRRAQGAADLAALAGAAALQHGQDGCAQASRVASAALARHTMKKTRSYPACKFIETHWEFPER